MRSDFEALYQALENRDASTFSEYLAKIPQEEYLALSYQKNEAGDTLINLAVKSKNYPAIQALLEKGVDFQRADTEETPIGIALASEDFMTVGLFIEVGLAISLIVNKLIVFEKLGAFEKYLSQLKSQQTHKIKGILADSLGEHLLNTVREGNIAATRRLLALGASRSKTHNGITAIEIAHQNHRLDIIVLFAPYPSTPSDPEHYTKVLLKLLQQASNEEHYATIEALMPSIPERHLIQHNQYVETAIALLQKTGREKLLEVILKSHPMVTYQAAFIRPVLNTNNQAILTRIIKLPGWLHAALKTISQYSTGASALSDAVNTTNVKLDTADKKIQTLFLEGIKEPNAYLVKLMIELGFDFTAPAQQEVPLLKMTQSWVDANNPKNDHDKYNNAQFSGMMNACFIYFDHTTHPSAFVQAMALVAENKAFNLIEDFFTLLPKLKHDTHSADFFELLKKTFACLVHSRRSLTVFTQTYKHFGESRFKADLEDILAQECFIMDDANYLSQILLNGLAIKTLYNILIQQGNWSTATIVIEQHLKNNPNWSLSEVLVGDDSKTHTEKLLIKAKQQGAIHTLKALHEQILPKDEYSATIIAFLQHRIARAPEKKLTYHFLEELMTDFCQVVKNPIETSPFYGMLRLLYTRITINAQKDRPLDHPEAYALMECIELNNHQPNNHPLTLCLIQLVENQLKHSDHSRLRGLCEDKSYLLQRFLSYKMFFLCQKAPSMPNYQVVTTELLSHLTSHYQNHPKFADWIDAANQESHFDEPTSIYRFMPAIFDSINPFATQAPFARAVALIDAHISKKPTHSPEDSKIDPKINALYALRLAVTYTIAPESPEGLFEIIERWKKAPSMNALQTNQELLATADDIEKPMATSWFSRWSPPPQLVSDLVFVDQLVNQVFPQAKVVSRQP